MAILKPLEIVSQMLKEDAFSQWMGVELIDVKPGFVHIEMIAKEEMLNGLNLLHGGISYSLADSALAFASNSRGRKAVSLETSISHLKPCHPGDRLIAKSTEDHIGGSTGVYHIRITNQRDELVALFKGTVFRTNKEWSNE